MSGASSRTARGLPGVLLLAAVLAAAACGNNPYPEADQERKILYTTIGEAPRTLDPAVAYNVTAHQITGLVYDTLLEYHYLKRPYTLIPGLATAVPQPDRREDGRTAYRFELRRGVRFAEDPAFELGAPGRRTREVVAEDVAFQLQRLADPAVNSPVTDPFSSIAGFRAFGERLTALAAEEPGFEARPARERYAAAGGIEGVRVRGSHALEVELARPYPQILYWFAMEFTTPVPWEAVAYYDGREERPRFEDHPVGTGPYRLTRYDKQFQVVLERNPGWYGADPRHRGAPGTVYPSEGAPGDAEAGLLEDAGEPLPFIRRVEFRREKEAIPQFNKFLQGYYDSGGIVKESFDEVIQNDRLSPELAARGISLEKAISPSVFYLGFNMTDEEVGEPAGERGRRLRQAMSLAVDAPAWIELFLNGRGVPAQSPIPPGLFGHEPGYENPFRRVDLERARALLEEAGYPGGVDPETGRPLELTFDTYMTSSEQLLQVQFLVNAWREIGLDVEVAPTTYNQFQQKVENQAYQIFLWGWQADYPDPENFLFLLTCDMRRSTKGGPNTANFCDARYDRLFERMKVMDNGPAREAVIREMIGI
ncbi:MAG: ABC transporter substrate-binding protein, partial [Myxococcota bacterium]|nr:ABC transporter substrate-binding protein [Myxococcota bacterium]